MCRYKPVRVWKSTLGTVCMFSVGPIQSSVISSEIRFVVASWVIQKDFEQ